MSFSGVREFHVNGIAKIYVFNPPQYLGYCTEQGVQIELDPKFLPVHTDAYGDQVPEDVQNMGMLATINFELLKWDHTVLEVLQTFAAGASGATPIGPLGAAPNSDGVNTLAIGSLLKQCEWMFPVIIQRGSDECETNVEGPYEFTTCYVGPDSFNMGTRVTRHKMTFNCLPNASGIVFHISSTVV